MKKNVLALSIATAVVGFAGSAHAIQTIGTNGPTPAVPAATDLQFGNTGTGHMLLVPYFSTQDGNATLLSLINTDTVNGKAVKVRFRGARNSDDIFDFQVFLSPGDVWTANVSKNKDGLSYLTTEDNSCTKPAKATINQTPFITARLNPLVTAEERANNTREGYIEIFNMADIKGTAADAQGLFPLIKHANSKAECANKGTNTAWSAINTDLANEAAYKAPAIGMSNPTSGLAANWTIMNVPKALSWSGSATAIEAVDAGRNLGFGNIVYFPQSSTPVGVAATNYSSDPLFGVRAGTSEQYVAAALYDLPDMSTPYAVNYTSPAMQAIALAEAIETKAVINEYWTEPDIHAETDWVFSMPTRRYAVAVDYAADKKPAAVYNTAVNRHFTTGNTTMNGDAVCVMKVSYNAWDREENSPASPDDVVISPGTPTAPTLFCGETSVLSFNNAGTAQSAVLGASVALKDMDTGYTNGWAQLNTPGAATGAGLPIVGQAFVSALNPSVAAGTAGNFGVNWGHRFVRVAP